MDATLEKLIHQVINSELFSRGDRALELLKLYRDIHPNGPTVEDVRRMGGPTAINRLNDRLDEYFLKNRSLWPEQKRIFVPLKGKSEIYPAIKTASLSGILPASMKFWFWQVVHLGNATDTDNETTQSLVTFSEPLFFFSKKLRAYFRFLDINDEDQYEPQAQELGKQAADEIIRAIIPNDLSKKARERIQDLDLVPARNYIPVGDGFAAVAIRGWFRKATRVRLGYKEAIRIQTDDHPRTNLIVLASRSSVRLLQNLQTKVPDLKIKLEEKGIQLNGKFLEDDVSGKEGFNRVRVVVTNWAFSTKHVHTYIASNHTRALLEVAKILVDDDQMKTTGVADAIVDENGEIPAKLQLAFEVDLGMHETQANPAKLIPLPNGKAIFY